VAIVALGIDLIWGYTGLQVYGVFCAGRIIRPGCVPKIAVPNLDADFMGLYGATGVPSFWKPFYSLSYCRSRCSADLTCGGNLLVFRNRIRGIFFHLTQAATIVFSALTSMNKNYLTALTGSQILKLYLGQQ